MQLLGTLDFFEELGSLRIVPEERCVAEAERAVYLQQDKTMYLSLLFRYQDAWIGACAAHLEEN